MTEEYRTQSLAEDNNALSAFLRTRGAINDKLDVTRAAIDAWIENQPMPPPLRALAELEVLLKERRDGLQEMVVFHDALMSYLVQLRGGESKTPTRP